MTKYRPRNKGWRYFSLLCLSHFFGNLSLSFIVAVSVWFSGRHFHPPARKYVQDVDETDWLWYLPVQELEWVLVEKRRWCSKVIVGSQRHIEGKHVKVIMFKLFFRIVLARNRQKYYNWLTMNSALLQTVMWFFLTGFAPSIRLSRLTMKAVGLITKTVNKHRIFCVQANLPWNFIFSWTLVICIINK